MADRPQNSFLRNLSAASFAKLRDVLKVVDLDHGRTILDVGVEVEHVYFPETALISLITMSSNGQGVETTMAGCEGAAGIMEICGSGSSCVHSVVQIDGRAWRAPAATCRALALADPDFAAQTWKLLELQMFEARQSALCQAMHPVEARFCRWLLESLERTSGRNPMPLTQEFIAAMLGVQRTTVSAFASQLQKDGLITYSRGQLALTDRVAVARKSCECHPTIRRERERLGFGVRDRKPE